MTISNSLDDLLELLNPYINKVLENQDAHCDDEILIVKRFLSDLERDDIYIDVETAFKRIKAATLMRHTSDKWDRMLFTLQGWQIFAIVNIFGWKYKATGLRRFRKYYLDIPRKNGKTEFVCLIVILHWLYEGINGAECYFAATKRDQANIGFETAKRMLTHLRNDSRYVAGKILPFKNSMTIPSNGSKMIAVSSDSSKMDGYRPSTVVIDEFHAHQNNSILKIFETGVGNRDNSLISITTTAGFNRSSPCYKYREMCKSIIRGKLEDDSIFCQMFTMDDGDDWEDEKVWAKVNPNMGVSLNQNWLKEQYISAKNEGSASINQFKTKNLNIYTSGSVSFIADDVFMRSSAKPDLNKRKKWYAGLDLSQVDDLTAFVLLSEDGDVLPFYFAPETKVLDKKNKDGVDYTDWYLDNLIEICPGEAIDQRIIEDRVYELHKEYNIVCTCYDPWRSRQLIHQLSERGVEMLKMDQNFKNFTDVIDVMKTNFLNGEYKHNGHPILRWNSEHTNVKVSANERAKMFEKSEALGGAGKIDGMVALGMAEFGRVNNIEKKFKGSGIITLIR